MSPLPTALLSASFLLAGTLASEARCRWGGNGWRLGHEGPWQMVLSLRAGERCDRSFAYGGNVTLKRLNLMEQPAQGRIDLRQGGYLTYTPRAGYRGRDAFTIQVCGEESGHGSCTSLVYQVSVE